MRFKLALTPKQIRTMVLALRSIEGIRSKERERAYIRAMLKDIETQTRGL